LRRDLSPLERRALARWHGGACRIPDKVINPLMRPSLLVVFVLLCAGLGANPARALDKVNPYICPTAVNGSGLDCFLEAVPQTYTMCRQIKSIEILEFGMAGAQEGVNGAKTESCIDKHKLSMVRPYQAALRESTRNKTIVEDLRKLYDLWLDSMAKLLPTPGEADDGYKQRVASPYVAFQEQIKAIRVLADAPAKPAAPAPKAKKSAP
jgi:hypothetical protein